VSCRLQPDPRIPNRHRGFGYIEYETSQSAMDAVNSMNGFDLGGQLLRVGRAITPPNTLMPSAGSQMPTAAAVAAASITAKVMSMEAQSVGVNSVRKESAFGARAAGFGVAGPVGNVHGAMLAPPSVVVPQLGAGAGPSFVVMNSARPNLPPPAEIPVMTLGPGGVISQANAIIPSFVQGAGGPAISRNGYPDASMTAAGGTTVVSSTSTMVAAARAAAAAGVQSATANTSLSAASEARQPAAASLEELSGSLEHQENIEIRGRDARHVVMQKLMRASERKVVVLRNMCGPEDVDDELEAEINEECSKYGQVLKIVIYQECQSEEDNADVMVKIFVEFATLEAVDGAVGSLNGRYFGGRMIRADRYDSDLFEAGVLTA